MRMGSLLKERPKLSSCATSPRPHALTCLQPFGLVMVCKIELLDVGWGSRCVGVGALPLGKNPASCVGLVQE